MRLNRKQAEEYVKRTSLEAKIRDNIDYLYTTNSWYYNLKKQSVVLAQLYDFKYWFDRQGITMDDVVKVLCRLRNYYTQDVHFAPPTRYLARVNQLSRNKVENIIYLLSKTDVLDKIYDEGTLYVKINKDFFMQDPYIQEKCRSFVEKDIMNLNLWQYDDKPMKYPKYTPKTKFKHMKRTVLGVLVAYNDIIEEYCRVNKIKEEGERKKFNKRKDLKYVELPIKVLSRVLRMPEFRIAQYIKRVCENTNYISKHNMVYVDTPYEKHYINTWYKLCDMVKFDAVELEDGHPVVTKLSYLIHTEPFNNSNVGKYIKKHYNQYRYIVEQQLQFMQIDEELDMVNDDFTDYSGLKEFIQEERYSEIELYENNEEDTDKDIDNYDCDEKEKESIRKRKSGVSPISKLDRPDACQIINYSALMTPTFVAKKAFRINLKKIKNYTLEQCCRKIKELLEYMLECDINQLSYYKKVYEKLDKVLQTFIKQYKKENNINKLNEIYLKTQPEGVKQYLSI